MKKIFMSAALASLMMVGCQNEMIEGQSNDNGDMFTLEVVQGGSRTALDGKQTVWSNDDKIFVTSEDGKVSGVLHYKGNNKFAGHVFGGKTTRLSHVIFPVPVDGKVKLNQPTGDRLDLPMIGAFGDDKSTVAMANACALVNLPVTGSDEISLSSANANTLTGHYEYKDGDFIFIPGTGDITIEVKDNKAFFAAATDVKGEPVDELELKVGTSEESIFIPVEEGKISENNVPEIEVNENGTMEDAVMNVTNEEILQKALDQYDEVKLAGDITIEKGIVIAAEKQNTLDLNGFALAGSITNNGVLIIDDSSEVYKRQASSFSVTGGSTFIQGGSFTTDISAKLNGEVYSCVQNGKQWVVLPKASVFDNLEDVITNAKDGAVLYLVAGTYTFVGDQNVFQNKSFTLVGLGETNIEGTNGYTWKLDATEEGHIVNLKNVSLSIAENSSRGKINIVYVKNYLTVNLFNVTCGVSNGEAIVLDSGNQVNGEWVEGVRTVVNAYDVIVQENDVVAFMARPCRTGDYLENKTYTEFNFKNELSGNISICRPQKDAWSTGDNMFVNGIALPAYQAPAEDAE